MKFESIAVVVAALGAAPAESSRPAETKAVPLVKLAVPGEEVARVRLTMRPDVLTAEMHRKSFLMSFPKALSLSKEKPTRITKEPAYAGTPLYGELTIGTGEKPVFDLVFDTSAEGERLYVDANQNGDLTDDPAVAWDVEKKLESGTSLEVLLRLRAAWADSKSQGSEDFYGVTLRKAKGADKAFLTRAGVRTGNLELGGKSYVIALADNTSDATFDNKHATQTKKPAVWLLVDVNGDGDYHPTEKGREVLDTSKTFPIAGSWYSAEFPEDGSEVILKRAVAPPPVAEKPRNPLLKAGQTTPDFTMVAKDGAKAKLSDSRGKVRVIDFWATWCGPCLAAMPRVESLYQKVKDQGVEVIGLDVMDEEKAFHNWLEKNETKYHYRFARDADSKAHESGGVAEKWGVYAIPTLFLIDQQDKIVLVLQGFGDENEAKLHAALKDLGVKLD